MNTYPNWKFICNFHLVLIICQLIMLIDCCFFKDLPVMPNTYVNDTRSETQYRLGETVVYRCVDGYKEVNGTNHAICLHGPNQILRWTPPSSICVSEGCTRRPPERTRSNKAEVEGVVVDPPYPLGTKATYSCLYGFYKKEGTDTAYCNRDDQGRVTWTEPTLNCAAVSCADPGIVEHAERHGLVFTHPNAVNYTCHKGYYTRDESVLYCLPTGRWSSRKLPICQAVECPVLENPSNGAIEISERTFGAVATYSCFPGFRLQDGSVKRQCSSNGTWTGSEPICLGVQCKPLTTPPNGFIVHGKDSTAVNSIVIMKCLLNPERAHVSKCLESGEWNNSPPVCPVPPTTATTTTASSTSTRLMPLDAILCDDPGSITNGGLEDSQRDIHFPTNITLKFMCDPDYKLKGTSTLHCLPTGEWNVERMPACEKPLPISVIIGVTVGLLFLIALLILGVFLYKRKRKAQELAGARRKAHSIDARDIEEMRCLEKETKPIPVTSL